MLRTLNIVKCRQHVMWESKLCRLLSVACLGLYAVLFQPCSAVDTHHETAKHTMTYCLKNCSHLTRDLIERKLNLKITSRQSCYEECIRKFGKQNFHGNRQVKRIKRGNTAACEDAGNNNYRAVDKKNVTLTFHKLGKTDRFYAKISWTPPPESVNWTGYLLIYAMGRDWLYSCVDLKKTDTSYIMNNSSYGLKEGDYFRVKVLSLPQMDGVYVDFIRKRVRLTIKPTDKVTPSTTDKVTPSTTGNLKSCEEAAEGTYRGIDKKNVTLTFHKLGKTDRFYAKISWSPPSESVNWTGYKLIYATGTDWLYNCIDLKKSSTSYIVNNSSYGLERDDYFRVKVLSLPQIYGIMADFIRKIVQPTDAVNQGTTPSSSNAVNQGTTPSSSNKETHFRTSPFSDNKTSPTKVVIPIALVSVTIGVAVIVSWYYRRSKKPQQQLSSEMTT